MRLTVIGCGDAFGSGGRSNTCFMIETAASTVLLDCGASSPVALRAPSLESVLSGGIEFATPDKPGARVDNGASFRLDAQPLLALDRGVG